MFSIGVNDLTWVCVRNNPREGESRDAFCEGSACPKKFERFLELGCHFQAVHSHLEPGYFVRLALGLGSSSFPVSSQCPTSLGKLKPRLVKSLRKEKCQTGEI